MLPLDLAEIKGRRRADPDEDALRPRKHDVDEIVAHLAVAERQSVPSDDQIIMGHVRAALVLAQSLQRQFRLLPSLVVCLAVFGGVARMLWSF